MSTLLKEPENQAIATPAWLVTRWVEDESLFGNPGYAAFQTVIARGPPRPRNRFFQP
jgi:hypothetical protein